MTKKYMKYHIITLGCQMNYADSERLASYYEARGFERAKNEKEADVVIINTCMVREKAEHKIYSITNNLSQLNPKPKTKLESKLNSKSNSQTNT